MGPRVYESAWHRIDQVQVDEFAELSGGKGRLHVDPEFAAGTVFGGTVVHGLMLLGIISAELRGRTGLSSAEALDLQVTFRRPLLTGQMFKVRSRVAGLECEVELIDAEEEVLIEGRANGGGWSQEAALGSDRQDD